MPNRRRLPAPPPRRRPPPPSSYEEQEYSFDPEVPPSTPAKPHHFAINARAERQDLDELENDIDGALYSPEEYRELIPFIRQQVGILMLDWHSGQGDPVYAVGSFYFEGDPYPRLDVMETAESRLDTLWRLTKSRSQDKRELGLVLNWLRWEIAQAKSVNNNPGRGRGRGERKVLTEWLLGVVWDWEQADQEEDHSKLHLLSTALHELASDAGCLEDMREQDQDERGCDVAEELRKKVKNARVDELRSYVEAAAEVLNDNEADV
jgi:hypothetical protein